MKFLNILTWLSAATFLLVMANHFFNPEFKAETTLIAAISFAMFTLIGIVEYRAGRKKTAFFDLFLGALSCIALIVNLIR